MFGWCLHVFTDSSTWGQAESAVTRWPAALNTFEAQREAGDACQPVVHMVSA